MSIMAKTPSGYKKIGSAYLGERPVDKVFNANGDVVYALQRELTGVPPLLFKGKEQSELLNYRICGNTEIKQRDYSGSSPLTVPVYDGELYNYRIYGNTANGESVGDRTGNLFDGEILQGFYSFSNGMYYGTFGSYQQYVCTNKIECKSNTTYTIQVYAPEIISHSYGFVWWDENLNFISSYFSTKSQSTDITTFTATAPNNAKYMAFDLGANSGESTIVPSNVSWIMLNSGSTPLPYEPYGYKVPIAVTNSGTTSNETIYLPEPIKMVGSEAEYVDYYSQKQYFADGTNTAVTIPALPISTGTNTVTVNTTVQPSSVEVSTDENVSVGDLVTSGQHAGEYKVDVIISRKAKHTATLQLHDCLPSTMQFDAKEALYYAENGLTAGTYNFTIQDYDTAYGGGKTYQFTLANDVPAKGQLVFGWSYNTQASAAKITSYASSTSTTAIEQVGVTEGSGGTSLGTTDGNSTNVNHIHRARYGSNNYKESAIRQFLNSSAVAGSVWTPQTKYDRPPSWNASTAGFMKDIDSDFLAVLGTSPKVVALNTVTDGGSVTINNDKFFLLSRSEVYGGKENNINEGEPYPYYSNYSDLSSAGAGDDSNRIKYRSGTAQYWWLRSPNSTSGCDVRIVYMRGSVAVNLAHGDSGVAPACNIELDDNYAYKGQILHVRDQISVQKGNDTLIFDVIGIDHDDVNFDVTITPIYLPEPIKMVGNEAEYIDYSDLDVTLPALPTIKGTNEISVDTEVQPSRMNIKGRIKSLT